MAKLVLTLVSVLLVIPLLVTTEKTSELGEIKGESNAFALDIYKALRKSSKNLVVSPFSIQILLTLALQGASGKTADEIKNVLHQNETSDEKRCIYRQLIKGLQKGDALKLATKMFIEKSFTIESSFKNASRDCFLSEAEGLDFKGNPEGAREQINNWVEENTNKKIKNLFPQGSLDEQTKLVLANAIHFKADWNRQFDKKYTREGIFYVSPTQEANVTMMKISDGQFPNMYSTDLKASVIALPYKEDNFRMVIFLPHEKYGLEELESKINPINVLEAISQMRNTSIDIIMPKFKLQKSMNLENTLSNLGMPTAFSTNATFTGISNENLRIDKVIQKAFIEVNEEGTEAAAATGISFVSYSGPTILLCDHPFIYMILKGDVILFIGKFSGPED